jgi:hypothetical protein
VTTAVAQGTAELTTLSVQAALREYLDANGFDVRAYDAPEYQVDLSEVTGEVWAFPNTPTRKRAVALHDLHHVVTGYGTDVLGEAEIGAWELCAGCNSAFLWWINSSAVGLGLLLSPGRVLRAGARAIGQRTLYRDSLPHEELLALPVVELRKRLGVAPEGQAQQPGRLHHGAPGQESEPDFSIPLALRRALRALSRILSPVFGGRRVSSHAGQR